MKYYIVFASQIRLAGAPSAFLDQVLAKTGGLVTACSFSPPPQTFLNQIFIFQVVTINLFGLVVVGGDNAFHVLTVKQIEEQDNCSKQVSRDPPILEN